MTLHKLLRGASAAVLSAAVLISSIPNIAIAGELMPEAVFEGMAEDADGGSEETAVEAARPEVAAEEEAAAPKRCRSMFLLKRMRIFSMDRKMTASS